MAEEQSGDGWWDEDSYGRTLFNVELPALPASGRRLRPRAGPPQRDAAARGDMSHIMAQSACICKKRGNFKAGCGLYVQGVPR